jgi:hypothetical protein
MVAAADCFGALSLRGRHLAGAQAASDHESRQIRKALMFRTALAVGLTLAFGSVQAAETRCKPLAKFKADFADAKTHMVQLTSGQFHFVEGIYVGNPTTPDGLPPGDGAMIVTHDGDDGGIIVWTHGALACAPIPIDEKIMKLMAAIKTGAVDGEGNEL